MERNGQTNQAALARILGAEQDITVHVAGQPVVLQPADPTAYLDHQALLSGAGEGDAKLGTELILKAVEETTGLDRLEAAQLLRVATARGESRELIDAAYTMIGMPPRGDRTPSPAEVVERVRTEITEACRAPHTETGQVPAPVLQVLERLETEYAEADDEPDDEEEGTGTGPEVFGSRRG